VNEKIRITSLSHSILRKLLFILPLFTLYVKVSKKFLTVVWDYTLDIPFELRNVVLYGQILSARLVLRLFFCVGDAALGIPLCRADNIRPIRCQFYKLEFICQINRHFMMSYYPASRPNKRYAPQNKTIGIINIQIPIAI
jgi:hypothetical protein